MKKDFLTNLDHHAYCLVNIESTQLISSLENNHKIFKQGNPDFFHEKFETLGIDDSRRIKEVHASKPFSKNSKKIFVIECSSITHEAQNSLLKIFEEPNEDTHFFLLIPSATNLLPTLRSRLYIIEGEKQESDVNEVQAFLKLSLKDKITFVDDLAKRISDEKATKAEAIEFLNNLEKVIYEKGIEKNQKTLRSILKARDYMNDRSSSVKQLLEFVALSI